MREIPYRPYLSVYGVPERTELGSTEVHTFTYGVTFLIMAIRPPKDFSRRDGRPVDEDNTGCPCSLFPSPSRFL